MGRSNYYSVRRRQRTPGATAVQVTGGQAPRKKIERQQLSVAWTFSIPAASLDSTMPYVYLPTRNDIFGDKADNLKDDFDELRVTRIRLRLTGIEHPEGVKPSKETSPLLHIAPHLDQHPPKTLADLTNSYGVRLVLASEPNYRGPITLLDFKPTTDSGYFIYNDSSWANTATNSTWNGIVMALSQLSGNVTHDKNIMKVHTIMTFDVELAGEQ